MKFAQLGMGERQQRGQWMVGLIAATIILIIGVNVYLLVRERAHLLEQSARSQRDLIDAVSARLRTTLQKADLLTRIIALDQLRARTAGTDEIFRPILRDALANHADLALALIADAQGNPISSSLMRRPAPFSVADRDYFRYHQDINSDGLYVGATVVSRATDERIIPVSRRINDATGRFLGVVMVGLSVDAFERDFAGYRFGPNSILGVGQTNGTILIRLPSQNAIGRNLKNDRQFSFHYDRKPTGQFTGVSPIDGQERRYVFRVLDDYPLVVFSAIPDADSLAIWVNTLFLKSGYVLLISLLLLVLALYQYRQHRLLGSALGVNHAVLDSTSCGIVAIDNAGKVLLFNRAASKLMECSQQEGYQTHPIDWHEPEDLNLVMLPVQKTDSEYAHLSYQRALDEATVNPRPEWLMRRSSGEVFPAAVAVAPIMDIDGHRLGHVLVFDDLTREKALEHLKTDFISVVSHELRTPLTAIKGAIAIVNATLKDQVTPQQARLLGVAAESCDWLVRLVSDILDLDRLARGQMPLHRTAQPLLPLLQKAIRINEPSAREAGVSYQLIDESDSLVVDVDADRLLQVLVNLLSNATKFSEPGSAVRLRAKHEAGFAVIAVEDDGAGIPEAFQPHVFDRFTQAEAAGTRKKGGSGLGLSIAKALVEAHGGTLTFESVEGRGTTFFVRLPLTVS